MKRHGGSDGLNGGVSKTKMIGRKMRDRGQGTMEVFWWKEKISNFRHLEVDSTLKRTQHVSMNGACRSFVKSRTHSRSSGVIHVRGERNVHSIGQSVSVMAVPAGMFAIGRKVFMIESDEERKLGVG